MSRVNDPCSLAGDVFSTNTSALARQSSPSRFAVEFFLEGTVWLTNVHGEDRCTSGFSTRLRVSLNTVAACREAWACVTIWLDAHDASRLGRSHGQLANAGDCVRKKSVYVGKIEMRAARFGVLGPVIYWLDLADLSQPRSRVQWLVVQYAGGRPEMGAQEYDEEAPVYMRWPIDEWASCGYDWDD